MNALANMLPAIFRSASHHPRQLLTKDFNKRAVDPSSNADGGFANNSSQKTAFPVGTATQSATTKATPSASQPVTTPSSSASSSSTATPTSSASSTVPPSSTASAYLPTSSTASASSSASSSSDSSGGISGGAIGAIVAVILIICGGCIAFLIIRRRRQKRLIARAGAGAIRDPYNEGFVSFPPPPPPMALTHHQQVSATAGPAQYQHQLQPMQPITAPNMVNTPPLSAPNIPATILPAPVDIWQQTPIGTFTVVSTYVPTLTDEIDVQPNDQVQIFEEYDDGWCLGVNLSRGQAKGVFPKHCVVAATANPSSMSLAVSEPTAVSMGKRVSSLYMENPNPVHS